MWVVFLLWVEEYLNACVICVLTCLYFYKETKTTEDINFQELINYL